MTITINKLKEYGLQPVLTPSGIDIRAPERVDIPVGQHYTVGSGVGLDIPEGYVGIIYPRSKMALKKKNQIHAQLIHHDHKDEIQINLYNSGKDVLEIKAGDLVAQIIVTKCETEYLFNGFI